MDHVSVVVDDLEAAIAFFVELGLELEGKAPVEGRWVDRVAGLDDVRVDIAMMRTPDGHGRLELMKFHTPTAVKAEPENVIMLSALGKPGNMVAERVEARPKPGSSSAGWRRNYRSAAAAQGTD